MLNRKNLVTLSVLLLMLVLASFSSLANSISWSVNIERMTDYTYFDSYPALMQTKDKRIWLVWAKEIMGNLTLCYKTSSSFGQVWSNESNLTTLLTPGQAQNPSIMQAANGTIWLVWTSNAPPPPPPPPPDFYMTATPQKLTIPQGNGDTSNITVTSTNNFAETITLSVIEPPEGVTAVLNPKQVTPPPNGEINSTLTVSVDPTAVPGNYTLAVLGKGTTQSHSIGVDLEITTAGLTRQDSEYINSIQSSELDYPFFDYEIHLKVSHDNGATWSMDTQITDNDVDDMRPCIIQLQNGTIMLAWQSSISGNAEICYKTTNGTSWSDTVQLTTDPANDRAPTITQTKNGQIWAAWSSDRYGDYEIFYKIFDGSSWSTDTRLTTNIDYDLQPAIIQAINGDIFVFWSSDTSGDFDIYYQCYNGTTWAGKTPFVASNYEDEWPAVMRAEDTKIWVAWVSNEAEQPDGNWDIYIKSSLAGDLNGDGIIDIDDLTIVTLAYGTPEGGPNYDSDADVNKDGIVDICDLRVVAHYFLET